jgi:hypothetical protein
MASALCPSGHYEVDNSTFDLWRLRSRNKSGTKVFCLWVLGGSDEEVLINIPSAGNKAPERERFRGLRNLRDQNCTMGTLITMLLLIEILAFGILLARF